MDLQDTLTPEAMLAASTARTGLDDFGDPAFREGLDRLLREVRAMESHADRRAVGGNRRMRT